jgi:hypothetical protein
MLEIMTEAWLKKLADHLKKKREENDPDLLAAIEKFEAAYAALYRNNLKNRDFGQEAPRRFDPERATIAPEARRERGSERGGKLTPPKTDSSGCFGIAEELSRE